MNSKKRALVTGGNGFIGSHIARRLLAEYYVRVIDVVDRSYFDDNPDIDFIHGDLLDPQCCTRAVEGIDVVLHFAADMGGMGVIHEENDFIIYERNHRMTMNIFAASSLAGVRKFFFASSACVYPNTLQGDSDMDVALKEEDAWQKSIPTPQGLYGLEKLHSETFIIRGATETIQIFIGRFHNVYGPRGSWKGGREKAPAALLRKAITAKILGSNELELWGDGSQRRSFCYIDDAVEGVLRLIHSGHHTPINIGSDHSVTMQEFAVRAAAAVGLSSLNIITSADKPIGVAARNSDNTSVRKVLGGWHPLTTLDQGMTATGRWIEEQMRLLIDPLSETSRMALLDSWTTSEILHLSQRKSIVFAILLPITSRTDNNNSSPPWSESLTHFATSLHNSIDNTLMEPMFRLRIYLAIDEDDKILHSSQRPAETILRAAGITDIVTLVCRFPRGRICSLWRETARAAWKDGCDYFVLMGDDVSLPTGARNWMFRTHDAFLQISRQRGVPAGFGCVSFTDISFPGMPTFPIIHRTHMDIFHGQVVPDIFVNQDGDPYLFQLYRRFGCATMIDCPIINTVGGSGNARYTKQHATEWTFGTLDEGTCKIEAFLGDHLTSTTRKLTLDIIIPCYRVNMAYLDSFLALTSAPTCSVMFIIIVDDPNSPNITELQQKYEHRWDIRIRINKTNLGASASRNRGLAESSAEWCLFLDDDVVPGDRILFELETSIRGNPTAAGFVGNAKFPVAESVFTAAVHLAGVTYFWDIAEKMAEDRDVPWGVTANLAARRNVRDGVVFDQSFPRTGGGEDIDYCRKKRQFSREHGGVGFVAAPQASVTHPYWNHGRRSYWRFYMWSKGDGALIKRYPHLVYFDFAPNGAELLFISASTTLALLTLSVFNVSLPFSPVPYGLAIVVSVVLSNLIHDVHRHLWRHKERTFKIRTNLRGARWVLAVCESTFIRLFSELGRLVGMLERKEWGLFGRRFDWFAGHSMYGNGPRLEERRNSAERMGLAIVLAAVFGSYIS
ncbi:glycosyltransferase family 2 protein [Trametopsis cervina]|nr:glycosyltransferase family 2 protein [Trametopsis cervina]